MNEGAARRPRIIGRYALYDEIASGGMATVHFGRLVGLAGFSRTVAIKRLHPQFSKSPDFVAMFLDEARLAARVQHPNVVATLDIVALQDELFLVMEYVQGESLSKLMKLLSSRGERLPVPIVASIASGMLHGLHAAHEATSDRGEPLGIVHRDVSPQNVIVGVDGLARVVDFGVAKAADRLYTTEGSGRLKGKLSYMAPEQVQSQAVSRQTDVYAAGIVLWEMLTGQRLLSGQTEAEVMLKALGVVVEPPSSLVPGVPKAFDPIALRALARNPSERYATARDMALEIEKLQPVAMASEVGTWLQSVAGPILSTRAELLARIEGDSSASSNLLHGAGAVEPHREPVGVQGASAADSLPAASGSPDAGSPSSARSSRWIALIAVLVAIGCVLMGVLIGTSGRSDRAQPLSASGAPASGAPLATTAGAPMAEGSATHAATSPASTQSSLPSAASSVPARRPPPNRTSCDPPFRIDEGGRKIFKVECL